MESDRIRPVLSPSCREAPKEGLEPPQLEKVSKRCEMIFISGLTDLTELVLICDVLDVGDYRKAVMNANKSSNFRQSSSGVGESNIKVMPT